MKANAEAKSLKPIGKPAMLALADLTPSPVNRAIPKDDELKGLASSIKTVASNGDGRGISLANGMSAWIETLSRSLRPYRDFVGSLAARHQFYRGFFKFGRWSSQDGYNKTG